MRGQPWLTMEATTLSGAKPSWTTVSLTSSPSCSISNVTCERGSAAIRSRTSSVSSSAVSSSGVKVCQLYASRR
jgi:hypothetical protein